jgi:hypothetical protein
MKEFPPITEYLTLDQFREDMGHMEGLLRIPEMMELPFYCVMLPDPRSKEQHKQMTEWLKENAESFYRVKIANEYWISDRETAVQFLLTWS